MKTMSKIDTSKWKEFSIKSLGFTVHHGKRIKKSERTEGDLIFLTAGKENCGVAGTIGNDVELWNYPITVDMFGNAFYHNYQCSGDDNIYAFINNNLNGFIKMFIASTINAKLKTSFSYVNQFRQKDADALSIKLPTTNSVPDFKYMENYMRILEDTISTSLINLQSARNTYVSKQIDIRTWQNFHLYDIFEIDSGTKLDKAKMDTTRPKINFVGRSNFNNGITQKVNEIQGITPFGSGCLTLALGGAYLGSCFIQEEPFYTSQNVVVLIPKEDMDFEAKQFIATAIFKESQNNYRAFIKELNSHIKTDFVIKLPVNPVGKPDYDYMSKYMQGILKKAKNSLNTLLGSC